MTHNRTPTFAEARNRHQKARAAGLHPDYWYAVAFDRALKPGKTLEIRFWNTSIVLYRGHDGTVRALENRCAHRQLKLSLGVVEGCNLTCAYHGWSYDGDGRVVGIDHDLFGHPKVKVQIRSYPVQVRYGLIWVFPGDPIRAADKEIPFIPELEGPEPWATVTVDFTWRAHHSMIIDNVGDFTHAYLHRKYQPFVGAKMTRCETKDDRVFVAYDTKVGMGLLPRLLVDRNRVNMDYIEMCFDYPYQWSNTGDAFKTRCFLAPLDETTTRVFFLFTFATVLRLAYTPLRIPRWLMTPLVEMTKRLHLRRILEQDGGALEAEQEGYARHPHAPMIEINPAIGLFQDLVVRKWEEHLRGAPSAAPVGTPCPVAGG